MKTTAPYGLHELMAAYLRHCPHYDDEVSVQQMARVLRWDVGRVRAVAEWARDRYMIETDAGMGDEIEMLMGRDRT